MAAYSAVARARTILSRTRRADLGDRDLSSGRIEQIPRHHLGTWGRLADVRRGKLIGRIVRRGAVVDNQGREREAGQILTFEISGNDPAADPRLVIHDNHAVDYGDDPVARAEAIHQPTACRSVRVQGRGERIVAIATPEVRRPVPGARVGTPDAHAMHDSRA